MPLVKCWCTYAIRESCWGTPLSPDFGIRMDVLWMEQFRDISISVGDAGA